MKKWRSHANGEELSRRHCLSSCD